MIQTFKSFIPNIHTYSKQNKVFLLFILIFGATFQTLAQDLAVVNNLKKSINIQNNSAQKVVLKPEKFGEDDVVGFSNAKAVNKIGNISIQLKNFHREKVEISLFDEIGELLYAVYVEPTSENYETIPFKAELKKGIYYVKVKGIRNIITQDIVIR